MMLGKGMKVGIDHEVGRTAYSPFQLTRSRKTGSDVYRSDVHLKYTTMNTIQIFGSLCDYETTEKQKSIINRSTLPLRFGIMSKY